MSRARWFRFIWLMALLTACARSTSLSEDSFGDDDEDAGLDGSGGPGTDDDASIDGGNKGDAGDSGPANPCDGVVCNAPPPKACEDEASIRVYEANGTCDEGQCTYADSVKPCPGGCANDACVDDSCVGVVCNAPPANKCKDAEYLLVYEASGACSEGQCSYSNQEKFCAFGCAAGVCNGDPCEGKDCSQLPANYCSGPNTLFVYDPGGVCKDGQCTYPNTRQVHCAGGCQNGACKDDPCAGKSCNTPPAARDCKDANTARVYASQGTCAEGVCSYQATETACPYGCKDGFCQDCKADGDCGGGKWCSAGTCTACNGDLHCGASCANCPDDGKVCSNGACVQCVSDGQCGPGKRCSGNVCVACDTAAACGASCTPCSGSTPSCNGGQCVCNGSSCGTGATCNGTSCVSCNTAAACGPSCVACTGTTPVCAGAAIGCRCSTSPDSCGAGTYCNGNSCVSCTTDTRCGASCTNCAASGKVCSGGQCVQCVIDANCGPGKKCNAGTCTDCNTQSSCGPSCVSCGGTTPVCGGSGVGCQCTTSPDSCGSGAYCNGGSCAACTTDARCGASCVNCAAQGKMCSNGQCVECVSDGQCPSGEFCSGNACVTCDTAQKCGPNCMSCGGSTPTCSGGACVCSGNSCGANQQCIGNACAVCKSDSACGSTCSPCGGTTPYCQDLGTSSRCVACRTDGDCPGEEVCDATTRACKPTCPVTAQSVFSDAFASPNSASWTTGTDAAVSTSRWRAFTNAKHGVRLYSGRLEITNRTSGSPGHGQGYAYVKTGGTGSHYDNTNYAPVLKQNTGREVIWSFNMRRSNDSYDYSTDGGFKCSSSSSQNGNTLGVAYVLATDSAAGLNASTSTCSPTASASGYAVVLGGDPSRKIRLVRFTQGLRNGAITNLITATALSYVDNYASVRVTYNAKNDQWKLEVRDDGTSKFGDPNSGTFKFTGTATDATYVNSALEYSGPYFQTGCSGLCSDTFDSYFDNVNVAVRCAP